MGVHLWLRLQAQHVVHDAFGIARRAEELQRVVLDRLDPVLDVGHVLAGVVADGKPVAQHHGGDLRAQLLPGVCLGPEGMGEVAREP